jgi:hypothetical protein
MREHGGTISFACEFVGIGPRSAKCHNSTIIKMVGSFKNEFSGDKNLCGGGLPKVRDMIARRDYYPRPYGKILNLLNFRSVDDQPCTLSQRRLVQLPLHRFGLSLHDGELVGEGLISPLAGGPHLVQLPAKDDVLRNTNSDGNYRQERNSPRGAGRAPSRPIGGALLLLLGAALLKVALDSTDAPRNPAWLRAAALGIGLIAAVVICQGTILLLTGLWLL